MNRSRVCLLACCIALVACFVGCRIGGSSTLLDEANVQVLVSGLAPGDPLRIAVDGEVRETVGAEIEPLVVYLTLAAGAYVGSLEGGAPARCGSFAVAIEGAEDVDVVAIDVAALPECAEVDDAGVPDAGIEEDDAGIEEDDAGIPAVDAGIPEVDAGIPEVDAGIPEVDAGFPADAFVLLEESVNDVVCIPPCSVITTVRSDSTITVIDHGAAPVVGALPDADLDALIEASISSEADALFSGADSGCLQVSLLGLVVLRRELELKTGTEVETADVSICGTGVAAQLRARLDLARTFLP